jgi:type IV secretion system protein TrbE
MFNLKGYQTQKPHLADALVWAGTIRPGVMLNKNGSLQATITYRGPDLESATAGELVYLSAQLNNVLRRFKAPWTFFVEQQRFAAPEYPDTVWPHPVPALMDEERRLLFSQGDYFESAYYLTLVWQTPTTRQGWGKRLLYENLPDEDSVNYQECLDYFDDEVTRTLGFLSDIFPYVAPLNDDETWSYLHSTISTKRHPVRMPDLPLYADYLLADQPLAGGIRPTLGPAGDEWYIRTATIVGFPSDGWPCMLDGLNALALSCRFVVRFIVLGEEQALKEGRKMEKQWLSKRKGLLTMLIEQATKTVSAREDAFAAEMALDAKEWNALISSGEVTAGYATTTIVVMDQDPKKAAEKLALCERVVNNTGLVTIREDIGAVGSWFGSHPGNVYGNVRRPVVHTGNLARMFPGKSALWSGPSRNTHLDGPCILQAVSMGQTPFRENFHVGDVGDVFVVGPKGAGKSFWLALHATQFLKYAKVDEATGERRWAQVHFLDKDYSAMVATASVGGKMYIPGEDDALTFQPLADLHLDSERTWAMEWLAGLFANERVLLTPQQTEVLWAAVCAVARLEVRQRTLTGLTVLCQDNDLRQVLHKYTVDGPHGGLLDADTDTTLDGHWHWYELSTLLRMKSVLVPTMTCFFHKIAKSLTGAPTVVLVDEGAFVSDEPVYVKQVVEYLKTLRKLNGSVWFATQSLMDSDNSVIGDVLFQECLTKIYLANPAAHSPRARTWYERWGLNERQIDLIANATPKRHYYFAQGRNHRLYDLAAGPVQVALCSGPEVEERPIVRKLYQEHPQDFAAQWLRHHRNLGWAADALEGLRWENGG